MELIKSRFHFIKQQNFEIPQFLDFLTIVATLILQIFLESPHWANNNIYLIPESESLEANAEKEKAFEIEGTIVSVLAGTMFKVQLENGHTVLAHISGKMRKRFIRLVAGDKVKMEMSPYDKDKARLVAQGSIARAGMDFFSTSSPMAQLTVVRALFAVGTHLHTMVLHSDVPQAFIQRMMDTNVFVELPKGITVKQLVGERGKPRRGKASFRALRLVRSLCGLKQAGQLWNK